MRAGDRVRLPVPLERIPTVYPLRAARNGKAANSRFRVLLKRLREALRSRSQLESDYSPRREQDNFFHPMVNPATGLLMNCGVDAAGNPYGVDLRKAHHPVESPRDFANHENKEMWDDPDRRHTQAHLGREATRSYIQAEYTD